VPSTRRLPHGARLPLEEWRTRHRILATVIAVHLPALWVYALLTGHGVAHATASLLPVAALLGVAGWGRGRRVRSLAAATGLLSCSAAAVHLSDGLVEAHFHYFVAVALVALYEEWLVYVVAIGFVVLQHGIMGSLEPGHVFGHPDGNPWLWTGVHTVFIAALCATQLAFWRVSTRAQERHQGTLRRAGQVLHDSPLGIARTTLDGVYVEINPAFCTLLGRDAEQILGRPFGDFTHAEDTVSPDALVAGDGAAPREKRFIRPDGSEVWALVTLSVLADDAGRPAWVLSQAQDITERRQLRETRLHLALQAAGTGSWEWDLVAGTVHRSATAAHLLGLGSDPSGPAYAQMHPDDRAAVAAAQERAIAVDGRFDVEYRIPQPDGTVRWVHSRAELLRDAHGAPARIVGVSLDVTDRHRAEEDRQQAAERAIRLQRLTAALTEALTVEEVRAALDATAAEMPGSPRSLLYVHDPDRTAGTAPELADSAALRDALRDRRPRWVPAAGAHGAVKALPLLCHGVLHGGWELRWTGEWPLTPEDQRFLRTAADLVATTVERAGLSDQQREVAELLQRTLLPERLPQPPGVITAARYLPAGQAAQVGGDWYDVIPLPDGRIGVTIGDVSGHGVRAAALMGQLRGTLRAYALEGHSPGRVLAAVNRAAGAFTGITPEQLATVAYAVVDPATGRVRYARAGHPPLVLVDESADGWSPRVLDGPAGLPLGVDDAARYPESSADLAIGTWLLGYTDGLVERRGESLDTGLARLLDAVTGTWRVDLDDILGELLAVVPGPARDDDIALIALRTELTPSPTPLRLPEPRRGTEDRNT
jgi:PAS domain S-box-containing protein